MADPVGFDVGLTDATYEVVIFHGYTGSSDSSRDLAGRIARECDAHVTVPLLPGHGTKIEDLQNISFDQFLEDGRAHARAARTSAKPLVLIGYCFGGYIAAMLAKEFQPTALVIALTPLIPRFPFGIPGVAKLLNLKSTWSKFLYPYEKEMRKPFFYYHRVPGNTQLLILQGIARMKKILASLSMPICTIHTTQDPTCRPESGARILALSGHHSKNESHILPNRRHNLFFGPQKEEDISIVIEFLKKNLS